MRGSFKQIQKKKKGVWSPSLSHSALLLLKTIWLFALQSANLFFFFFFFFSLTHFILTLCRSCLCMYIWSFTPSFFFFKTCSLLCLALLQLDHFFLLSFPSSSSSSSSPPPCPFTIFHSHCICVLF